MLNTEVKMTKQKNQPARTSSSVIQQFTPPNHFAITVQWGEGGREGVLKYGVVGVSRTAP